MMGLLIRETNSKWQGYLKIGIVELKDDAKKMPYGISKKYKEVEDILSISQPLYCGKTLNSSFWRFLKEFIELATKSRIPIYVGKREYTYLLKLEKMIGEKVVHIFRVLD